MIDQESFLRFIEYIFSSEDSGLREAAYKEARDYLSKGSDNVLFTIVDTVLEKNISNNIESYTKRSLSYDPESEVFHCGVVSLPFEIYGEIINSTCKDCASLEEAFCIDLHPASRILVAKDYSSSVCKLIDENFSKLYSVIESKGLSVKEVFGYSSASSSTSLTGRDYEFQICSLLERLGWSAEVTKASADQGIDIIASLKDWVVGIQCKFYNGSVGNSSVQQAYAGSQFYEYDLAMVISNSEFTLSAKKLAQKLGVFLLHDSQLGEFTDHLLEHDRGA